MVLNSPDPWATAPNVHIQGAGIRAVQVAGCADHANLPHFFSGRGLKKIDNSIVFISVDQTDRSPGP
jgi:hypothetical protein